MSFDRSKIDPMCRYIGINSFFSCMDNMLECANQSLKL